MMTQPGVILATGYHLLYAVIHCYSTSLWYFTVFIFGLFKIPSASDSAAQHDLYVESPPSQMLDEGTKCQKSENRMQSFFYYPPSRVGQSEAEHAPAFTSIRAGCSESNAWKEMKRSSEKWMKRERWRLNTRLHNFLKVYQDLLKHLWGLCLLFFLNSDLFSSIVSMNSSAWQENWRKLFRHLYNESSYIQAMWFWKCSQQQKNNGYQLKVTVLIRA